jgi:hypothetical protein
MNKRIKTTILASHAASYEMWLPNSHRISLMSCSENTLHFLKHFFLIKMSQNTITCKYILKHYMIADCSVLAQKTHCELNIYLYFNNSRPYKMICRIIICPPSGMTTTSPGSLAPPVHTLWVARPSSTSWGDGLSAPPGTPGLTPCTGCWGPMTSPCLPLVWSLGMTRLSSIPCTALPI